MPETAERQDGVHNAAWSLLVLVEEPHLSNRGVPIPAKVRIDTEGAMSALTPDSARELAEALLRGADRAEEVDAAVLPHLSAASAALAHFFSGETA